MMHIQQPTLVEVYDVLLTLVSDVRDVLIENNSPEMRDIYVRLINLAEMIKHMEVITK